MTKQASSLGSENNFSVLLALPPNPTQRSQKNQKASLDNILGWLHKLQLKLCDFKRLPGLWSNLFTSFDQGLIPQTPSAQQLLLDSVLGPGAQQGATGDWSPQGLEAALILPGMGVGRGVTRNRKPFLEGRKGNLAPGK